METKTKKNRRGLRDRNGRLTRLKAGDRIALNLTNSTVCIFRKDSDNTYCPLRWPDVVTGRDDKYYCSFLSHRGEFVDFAYLIGPMFGLRPRLVRCALADTYMFEFE